MHLWCKARVAMVKINECRGIMPKVVPKNSVAIKGPVARAHDRTATEPLHLVQTMSEPNLE